MKLWNQDWVYVSDEVYGTITGNGHGCPWGWTRMIDIADETRPVVRSEFRLPENQPLVLHDRSTRRGRRTPPTTRR